MIDAVNFALETYDIEGDIIDEVAACMEIVIQALPASSLSSYEKLAWAVDMDLGDSYELCYDALENIWNNANKKSDWHALADELQKRLNAIRSDNDLRRQVTGWLIAALEQTGREDEIIPLREREAEITGEYTQLIDLLIGEKHYEEAKNWCQKAITNTDPNHLGNISDIEDRLRTIQEKTGDYLSAAAFYADDFFSNPSLHTFQELCKSAQKAKVRPAVEAWARYFLETGHLPRTKGRKRKGEPNDKWPLPKTEFEKDIHPSEVPMIHLLIELAIAEKKPTEVLKWYDIKPSTIGYSWGYMYTSSLDVAQAIKEKYPDRAIAIWKELAESEISRVEVSGYQKAGTYLREVRDTLKRLNREKEWEAYLSELRNENKRRPRCLEVLDGLAGKRIIDRE